MQRKIENEGFLFINTESNETFKRGEIKDIYNNLICSGVIVPIINPIKEKEREPFDDEHAVTIDNCIGRITLYCPLQKSKKIRIYWDQINDMFMVSTESRIYSEYDERYDLSTVNFDLLDKQKCYYCTYSKDKGVTLMNIVDKARPSLECSYNIENDLAFENHVEWFIYSSKKEMNDNTKETELFKNGVLCILDNGTQLEMRSLAYNYYCMLAKPEHMSIYIYYILCLNKHAVGTKFSGYFISLLEYVREFTDAYPEHTGVCDNMTKKIRNYINAHDLEEDDEAIEVISKLLEMEPEELLQLLLKY